LRKEVNAILKSVRENRDSVLNKIRDGRLDAVHLSKTGLVDDIILTMNKYGILSCLSDVIPDKRRDNTTKPFDLILGLSIAAKMKLKTAMTDVPFAIQDHRVLSELGWNLIDEGSKNKGVMTEGQLRHLFGKYKYDDFFNYYNETVQKHIMPKMNLESTIHILDCTKIKVELSNGNYELSETARDSDGIYRGYKLATLRSLSKDTGIITDIRFSGMRTQDVNLSEDIILNSPMLKSGDILINDRGFLSRANLNYLKTIRNIDTYIPLRTNMDAFEMAVSTAKYNNKWVNHPNKRRKSQKVALVSGLGRFWRSDNIENDVSFNACVVWDSETDKPENEFRVFITTDLSKSAKQIIQTYELRPEIEEDYRQIKDFWKIEDFTSTKINLVAFHIMCVLFGYLFFQLYTMLPEGEELSGKSLPVVLKNYEPKNQSHLVFYVDDEFGIFTLVETMKLYASVEESVRVVLDAVMEHV